MHVVPDSFGEQGRFSIHLSNSILHCLAGFRKPFLQVGTAIQGIVCAKTGCSLVYVQ